MELNHQFVHNLRKRRISFAFWQLPGKKEIHFIGSEKCIRLDNLSEFEFLDKKGYLIVPFDVDQHSSVWIPDDSLNIEVNIENVHKTTQQNEDDLIRENLHQVSKERYIGQTEHIIGEIKAGHVNKAILSRIIIEEQILTDSLEMYNRLVEKYPNAYVFWYYTPITGEWMGASPELFVDVNKGYAKTVSLAGTRRNMSDDLDDKNWHQKEIDEQAFVTHYIEETLRRHRVDQIDKLEPETIRAGHLSHIKTTFTFKIDYKTHDVIKLLLDLHPTPAVCGVPKNKSFKLISEIEDHDRLCYGGFLGYFNDLDFACYVNIRSMKLIENDAVLFVGGGLTKDSLSEDEWNETELKAQTLLSILKK